MNAGSAMDFLMDENKNIEFMITPMDPKKKRKVSISLREFPKSAGLDHQASVSIGFLNQSTMAVAIRDKGFGDLFPASDVVVRQEVRL